MELIINTKEKAILIKNEVNLGELIKKLKSFFGKEWIDWKIKSVVETEYYYPYQWWYQYWPYEAYEVDYKVINETSTKLAINVKYTPELAENELLYFSV